MKDFYSKTFAQEQNPIKNNMEKKIFGNLKKGDIVYFYLSDSLTGPQEIRQYKIQEEPDKSYWTKDNITININLNGNNDKNPVTVWYDADFNKNLTHEVLDIEILADFAVFSPNLEELKEIRRETLESLLKEYQEIVEDIKKRLLGD